VAVQAAQHDAAAHLLPILLDALPLVLELLEPHLVLTCAHIKQYIVQSSVFTIAWQGASHHYRNNVVYTHIQVLLTFFISTTVTGVIWLKQLRAVMTAFLT
jgi:hypothetical protein